MKFEVIMPTVDLPDVEKEFPGVKECIDFIVSGYKAYLKHENVVFINNVKYKWNEENSTLCETNDKVY